MLYLLLSWTTSSSHDTPHPSVQRPAPPPTAGFYPSATFASSGPPPTRFCCGPNFEGVQRGRTQASGWPQVKSTGGGCCQAGNSGDLESISLPKDGRATIWASAGAQRQPRPFPSSDAVIRTRRGNLNKESERDSPLLPPPFPGDTQAVVVAVIQTLFP